MNFSNKLSEFEFKQKIAGLLSVPSISGNTLYDIHLVGENIKIFRRSTQKEVTIKLSELYDFYRNENQYKTTTAKKYISGRAQSPATAILIALTEKPS